MAALMRRAVQQAKAEAAGQLSAAITSTGRPDTQKADLTGSQGPTKAPANGKRALAAMLQKAARKMQEGDAAATSQTALALQAAADTSHNGAEQVSQSAEDSHASSSNGALDSDQVKLSRLAVTSSSSSDLEPSSPDAALPPGRQLSLGDRLVSMLKSAQRAVSPSRHASYVPMDVDSPPKASSEASPEASREAEVADTAAGEKPLSKSKGAPPRDASLGQRLGSLFAGSSFLPRQTSYMPVEEEAGAEGDESSRQRDMRVLPRDVSLRERYGSASSFRQTGHVPESEAGKGTHQLVHDELSVSGEPSHSLPTLDPALPLPPSGLGGGLGGDLLDGSAPLSPSRRRALPRDASYLPEWVHRTLGQSPMARGNGVASPGSRFGNIFSSVSAASDDEDSIPQWVDWPSPDQETESAKGQLVGVEEDDLDSPVPLLMAPPHLRSAKQDSAKEPLTHLSSEQLTFAPNLLVPNPGAHLSLALGTPQTTIATPKGQRLFDFWHQKADSMPSPVDQNSHSQAAFLESPSGAGPMIALHSERQAAIQASANQAPIIRPSPSESTAHQAPFSPAPRRQTAASQLPYSPASATQLSVSQSPSVTAAVLTSAPAFSKAEAAQAACRSQPQPTGLPTPHALHPSTAQVDLVAELVATSQLVQQQSLRQAELLEGLEQALLQLSEHRFLIQNPLALPQDSLSGETGAGPGEFALAADNLLHLLAT